MNPLRSRRPHLLPRQRRPTAILRLEVLEDRTLMSVVNVLVSNPASDTTSQDTQSETAVVLGSGSNVIVAFNDSESNVGVNRFTGFAQSSDGGSTFTDKGSLPASTAGDAGDPSLARDNTTGTIYLSTLGYSSSNVIQVFRSTDNGATFGAPVNGAPGASSSQTLDKDWITVDNASGTGRGNVYLTFTDFGGFFGSTDFGIYLTRSSDGGATWSSAISVTSNNTQGSWVTTGPDHAVYVAYWDGSGSTEYLRLAKSSDQGQTFNKTFGTIATLRTTGSDGDLGLTDATGQAVRTNAFPQVVVNPTNANILYAVFNDTGTATGDKGDVFFAESTDGGATWGGRVKVNDDTTTNDQWQPGLAVTPDGTHVGVFWYDRRLDAADSLIDRYGAIGTVSGSTVTFGANFRVTDTSFPAVVNQDPAVNTSYMGDYDQVAADNSYFYTTWGDNRLADSAHAHQPDVRFAKVAVPSSEHFSVTATASSTTAGTPFNITVTALKADGSKDTSYAGTVHLASSDGTATFADGITGLPLTGNNYTYTLLDQGTHSFTVTLTAAGSQTVSATDSTNNISGSTSVTVNPALAAKLAFGQQPTNTLVGATITPAVTVKVLDQYGNLVTTDNTDSVTLTIGTNPGGGTLSGTNPVTASGGVASFGNLSINKFGNRYTLTASSGTLTGATSNSFNVVATSVLEGFETSNPNTYLSTYYKVVGASTPSAVISTLAAHDGTYGLRDTNGGDWIYRNDAAAQVKEGDTISVWVKLARAADGRAYFGFGASASGTLSVVLAPNSGQFLVQNNSGYGFTDIGSANAPAGGYLPNHWYRLEVAWSTTGSITGRLYDSDGTTLRDTVTATTPSGGPTSGGIAFRATKHDKYWDTVTDTPGVNTTSPRSAQGVPASSTPADDEAEPDSGTSPATFNNPQQGLPGSATPAGTLPGAGAPADFRTAQVALFVSGRASVVFPPADVPGGTGVVTPPAAPAPLILVSTFVSPASHTGNGADDVAPSDGPTFEEPLAGFTESDGDGDLASAANRPTFEEPPVRAESLPRADKDAGFAPAAPAAQVQPTAAIMSGEQAITFRDEYFTALAAEELLPLPVLTEDPGPSLKPAAAAALAVLLLASDWHSPRRPERPERRRRPFPV